MKSFINNVHGAHLHGDRNDARHRSHLHGDRNDGRHRSHLDDSHRYNDEDHVRIQDPYDEDHDDDDDLNDQYPFLLERFVLFDCLGLTGINCKCENFLYTILQERIQRRHSIFHAHNLKNCSS